MKVWEDSVWFSAGPGRGRSLSLSPEEGVRASDLGPSENQAREDSKWVWKHSPAARVSTAFLILPNFRSCYHDFMVETQQALSINCLFERSAHMRGSESLRVKYHWSVRVVPDARGLKIYLLSRCNFVTENSSVHFLSIFSGFTTWRSQENFVVVSESYEERLDVQHSGVWKQ